jgi:hypothetical protein
MNHLPPTWRISTHLLLVTLAVALLIGATR